MVFVFSKSVRAGDHDLEFNAALPGIRSRFRIHARPPECALVVHDRSQLGADCGGIEGGVPLDKDVNLMQRSVLSR